MCALCDGETIEDFVGEVIADIEDTGWAVVAVEDDEGGHVHTYTAGLTRCHGHPELLFSGASFHTAHHVLDTLAAQVCAGRRLEAGQLIERSVVGRECLMVRVADPAHLVMVQAVYGSPGAEPVPALQVVWADEDGRWPWELCDAHRDGQEVHGAPAPGGE